MVLDESATAKDSVNIFDLRLSNRKYLCTKIVQLEALASLLECD